MQTLRLGIAPDGTRARIERGEYQEYDDALVVNNHYDLDGVLSVFACTNPTSALHAPLLIAGARRATSEWSTDTAVSGQCAVQSARSMTTRSRRRAASAPARDDLEATGGAAHEQLWADGWAAAVASWEALQSGKAELTRASGSRIGGDEPATSLQEHAASAERRPAPGGSSPRLGHVCGRAEGTKACTRVLRVEADPRERRWRYEYEKPGHGWVARLVERQPVPSAHGAASSPGDRRSSWEGRGSRVATGAGLDLQDGRMGGDAAGGGGGCARRGGDEGAMKGL